MPRWLVAWDEGYVDAPTAREAIEKRSTAGEVDFEIGHRLVAIDVDAIEGTDRMEHFRIGAEAAEPYKPAAT